VETTTIKATVKVRVSPLSLRERSDLHPQINADMVVVVGTTVNVDTTDRVEVVLPQETLTLNVAEVRTVSPYVQRLICSKQAINRMGTGTNPILVGYGSGQYGQGPYGG
jgi:hypothetical protein